MDDTNTHVDVVTQNIDGSIGITMSLFINPAVAASMDGAVVAGTCANTSGGTLQLVFTVVSGSPITHTQSTSDAGSSESA